MEKTQEKHKKNTDFLQETINNTPSKNDQDTHFFYSFFVYKPIQTPSNWSKTIGNDRNYLKLFKKNQKRSRKSKTIKSDQKWSRTIKDSKKRSKVIKKIEKRSKFFKTFTLQKSELGQFGIILDRFWNF